MSWRDIVGIEKNSSINYGMEWNGIEWNGGYRYVRYRVTNNGLAIKISIGNEVSMVKLAM